MDIYCLLILIYFTLNGFITGFAHGDENKVWYFSVIGVFTAIPVVLAVLLWKWTAGKLKKYGWFQDLIFWILLNLTNEWKGLEHPNEYKRAVVATGSERLLSQWMRIEIKYKY